MVRRGLEFKVEKGSEGGLRWVEVGNDNRQAWLSVQKVKVQKARKVFRRMLIRKTE